MASSAVARGRPGNRLVRWLLEEVVEDVPGPQAKEGRSEQHSWWQVVCLTGVDYFSTLGYIPANPIVYLFRFILFGEGDTAPVAHEALREPDPEKRPAIHVGGR